MVHGENDFFFFRINETNFRVNQKTRINERAISRCKRGARDKIVNLFRENLLYYTPVYLTRIGISRRERVN